MEPPSEAHIVWLPEADTSAIFLGPTPTRLLCDAEPPPTFESAYRIADDSEDILLYDLGNGQRVQLVIDPTAMLGMPLAASSRPTMKVSTGWNPLAASCAPFTAGPSHRIRG